MHVPRIHSTVLYTLTVNIDRNASWRCMSSGDGSVHLWFPAFSQLYDNDGNDQGSRQPARSSTVLSREKRTVIETDEKFTEWVCGRRGAKKRRATQRETKRKRRAPAVPLVKITIAHRNRTREGVPVEVEGTHCCPLAQGPSARRAARNISPANYTFDSCTGGRVRSTYVEFKLVPIPDASKRVDIFIEIDILTRHGEQVGLGLVPFPTVHTRFVRFRALPQVPTST